MQEIVKPILNWYKENKRVLSWRIDKDPYHVWISEIMLQQTRIEAVKGYYERFMRRLPTILDLSKIEEDELLKLWEGLGYYNRARNLKKAAIMIMLDYGGKFPNTYEEIKKLPGIGDYTAGAISSICFLEKQVAVDGNVMRVYARLRNADIDVTDNKQKKVVQKQIKTILPTNSGDFNEAIMELGETICLPNTIPKCELCPLKRYCLAYQNHTQNMIPRKIEKTNKKIEYLTVALLICNNKVAIRKRNEQGLLKNMWEFPNIEDSCLEQQLLKSMNISSEQVLSLEKGSSATHVFTHKKWEMQSYIIYVTDYLEEYTWVNLEEINNIYALPTAFKKFLKEVEKRIK